MSKHPKKDCPICGKSVSTHHLSWGNHMKSHEDKPAAPAAPAKETAVEAKEVTAKAVARKAIAVEQIGDPEERALYERALQMQERFLTAPDGFASPNVCDEHMELRKLYAPDTIDKRDPITGKMLEKAPNHAYIGDRRTRNLDVNRGYIPVFDERGSHVTTPGGDYLYKRDVRLFDAQQTAYAEESNAILRGAEQKAGGGRVTVGDDADIPDPETDMITMEEATTSRGEGNVNVS